MIHDDNVIDLLKGKNSLLDAYLLEVSMRDDSNGEGNITLTFRPRRSSEHSEVTLQFTELIEFGFNSDDGLCGDVEFLKFFKLDDQSFYISLDPDPYTMPEAGAVEGQVSESDNFVIRARHVSANVTESAK